MGGVAEYVPFDLLGPADDPDTTDSECALLRVLRERVAIVYENVQSQEVLKSRHDEETGKNEFTAKANDRRAESERRLSHKPEFMWLRAGIVCKSGEYSIQAFPDE